MKKTLVIIIVILGISFLLIYFKDKLSFTSSTSISLNHEDDQMRQRCNLYPTEYSENKNNQIINEAKVAFISNTKISEPYFNTHFTFECVVSGRSTGDTTSVNVYYLYHIGDYHAWVSIKVPINDDPLNKNFLSNFIKSQYGWLYDIQNAIPKQEALEKLTLCLVGKPSTIFTEIGKDHLVLYGKSNSNLSLSCKIDLETGQSKEEYTITDPPY